MAELSLVMGSALREELTGEVTAGFPGRAANKLHGLVQPRADMQSYYFTKNAIGAAITLPASAAVSANGRSTPQPGGRRLLSLRLSQAP
jgi:hypothetical protein